MKECARVSSKFIEFSSLQFLFRHKSRFQSRCRHKNVLFLCWKHRFEFIFDLNCKLSSIKSNNFHNSLSLFYSWNAFRLKQFDFINETSSKQLRYDALKITDIEHHEKICFHRFIDLRYISWGAILSASSLRAKTTRVNCTISTRLLKRTNR